jgi:hypothetical protein
MTSKLSSFFNLLDITVTQKNIMRRGSRGSDEKPTITNHEKAVISDGSNKEDISKGLDTGYI